MTQRAAVPRGPGRRRRWLGAVLLPGLVAGLLAVALPGAAQTGGMVAAIARVKPSLVVVGTFKATDSPRYALRGTGFVVGDGNQVVTNAHVVLSAPSDDPLLQWRVQVRAGAGGEPQVRNAVVQEVDAAHDLAVLRIEGPPLPALALADSDRVQEGHSVALMGFPIGGALGFAPVTHRGMVSSITPASLPAPSAQRLSESAIARLRQGGFNLFQLDATAYPGNSGGPLFDPESAEVVGVVSMVLIKGARESALSQPTGITYAVPANFVRDLLRRAR